MRYSRSVGDRTRRHFDAVQSSRKARMNDTTRDTSKTQTSAAWGSDSVYGETLKRIEASGLRWRALRTVWDVDRPADLERLRSLRFSSASRPRARR